MLNFQNEPLPKISMVNHTEARKAGEAGPVASEGTTGPALSAHMVSYVNSQQVARVKLVGEWARGELSMVMSASSGPKDYIKNLICAAFEARPEIARIRMVVNSATQIPFCLFQVGANWFDCSGKQVIFS